MKIFVVRIQRITFMTHFFPENFTQKVSKTEMIMQIKPNTLVESQLMF